MFNKDGFMSYVGSASGSSYAGGLKAIENIYEVNIDNEYEKDKLNRKNRQNNNLSNNRNQNR